MSSDPSVVDKGQCAVAFGYVSQLVAQTNADLSPRYRPPDLHVNFCCNHGSPLKEKRNGRYRM